MTVQDDKRRSQVIAPHGGYRTLKSYQTAELVYDAHSGVLRPIHRSTLAHSRSDGAGRAQRKAEHR